MYVPGIHKKSVTHFWKKKKKKEKEDIEKNKLHADTYLLSHNPSS